jgi:EAL domain-containing protein (putative c-di-GMP-specific phosphodiesterase class I)
MEVSMDSNSLRTADVQPGHHTPLDYAVTSRDRHVVDMVREAISQNRVRLAFQPVVMARDHQSLIYYEGFVRVIDKTGRAIPAKDFINEVEATEIGRKIDCVALKQGLKALSANPRLRLAINLSARSIGYQEWNMILKQGIQSDPSVASRLILEITESSVIHVPELVVSFMTRLQKKGIHFALDDFGSGYTSFKFLKQFYFDILKIDGQFIRNIAFDSDNQIIAHTMATLAAQFDMLCVAENVETAADAEYLGLIGVEGLQGYLFGAPTVRPPWTLKARKGKLV